jgi:cytochrome oxidase assembly protein ShyY1
MSAEVLGAVVLLTMFTALAALLIGQWQAQREDAKKTSK